MTENTLVFPAAKDDHKFVEGERDSFAIDIPMLPSVWAEEYFMLMPGAGYASTGKLVLYPWQREPLDAIAKYNSVIYCGPVQTGKSLIAEVAIWYCVDTYGLHGMFCYAKRDTVENVFQDRIKPTIEQVPRLARLWDGNPDHLTKEKITLRNCIIRVASALVKSDIATFSAGLIYASEVCKYPAADKDSERSNFDVVKQLRGRQEAYGMIGKKKEILESSPIEEGDVLHKEMFKSGVLNLRPQFPCPKCGRYQEFKLEQIKEIPNQQKVCDHDPDRIRQTEAAYYECVHCQNTIQERDRIDMGMRVVWAAKGEVISKAGEITQRRDYNSVSFQWNRFVDYSFKFAEGLARWFEAQKTSDIVKIRTFLNEDMGEFASITTEKESTEWLRAKCQPYNTHDVHIPEGVLCVLCGIDTQDAGFYFVLRGFGYGKESWLLDCGFIRCEMGQDQSPEYVSGEIKKRLLTKTLITSDKRKLDIGGGFIDRGGHKQKFVDHIVGELPFLYPYIGSASKINPLIREGNNGLYLGNTQNLSRIVAVDAAKNNWHLPENINSDYINQFVKQYDREERDKEGNTKKVWIHGGNDHLRDCENYVQAAYVLLELDKFLFNMENMDGIKEEQYIKDESTAPVQSEDNFLSGVQDRWKKSGGMR